MTEFLLVRHGEPNYKSLENWANIYIATNFAPLTEEGIKQVYNVTKVLKEEHADVIITSPYTRTMQGAAIMSKELDIPFFVEPSLVEWQLDTTQSIKSDLRIKHLLKDFESCDGHYPKGKKKKWESKDTVKERVLSVFRRYKQYKKVIVSGHAVMMGYVTDEFRKYDFCEIKKFYY